MESDLRKYENYSNNIRAFLIAAGLWPYTHPVAKRILSFASFFSTFVVMLTVSNFCFHHASNVMVLTKGMGVAISFLTTFMKVCLFLLHNDDLVQLHDSLSASYDLDLKDPSNRPNLLKHLSAFTTFMYVDAITVAVTIFMYSIMPLLALKRYGKYVLVYPAVYPFAYEPGGIVHWILYVIEVVGGTSLLTVTIGVDCVLGLYSLQMCGQFRILAKMFDELKIDDSYRRKFRECIERHHMLMHAKNRVESAFGLIAIWLAISGSLVLCSLIFQVAEATKTNVNPVHVLRLCCYLIPKFLQIFMYAWYGNLIAEESAACRDSIYNSHWPESCDSRLKNDVLIVLTQQPLVLAAKGCMLIQLDMFTKIVKASVSYFHLLRTVNES